MRGTGPSCSKLGWHYLLDKSLSIGLSPLDRDLSSRWHYPPFEHYWALDGCFFIQGHNFQTLVSLKSTLGIEIKYSMTAFLMEVKLP